MQLLRPLTIHPRNTDGLKDGHEEEAHATGRIIVKKLENVHATLRGESLNVKKYSFWVLFMHSTVQRLTAWKPNEQHCYSSVQLFNERQKNNCFISLHKHVQKNKIP